MNIIFYFVGQRKKMTTTSGYSIIQGYTYIHTSYIHTYIHRCDFSNKWLSCYNSEVDSDDDEDPGVGAIPRTFAKKVYIHTYIHTYMQS